MLVKLDIANTTHVYFHYESSFISAFWLATEARQVVAIYVEFDKKKAFLMHSHCVLS